MSTPTAGIAVATSSTAGQPINAISPNVSGGFIINPLAPADQGLQNAETLYVSQVGPAALVANDTTLALQPGQSYSVIPGTTTGVSVASVSANHQFTCVQWI
jgi:hypothetical protein